MALSPGDPHSFARPDLARVHHTNLILFVDLKKKILKGQVILTIHKLPSVTEVILDSYCLDIISVIDFITGLPLKYYIGLSHAIGCSFIINLPQTIECTTTQIKITYLTSPTSPALHWLMPEHTADGTHPFLLCHGKLTYARALFPCQDTPSVKFTYSAEILVPRDFTVLMSARLLKKIEGPFKIIYKFAQIKSVPSYAVVMVVGSLQEVPLGLNTYLNMYAEKKFIIESIRMFTSVNIEKMLQIAKNICGPYSWSKSNICVLPPSISDFEIECPCLTFVSASLLGGDSSLFSSIAQNISQNWAGNLVTCANYEHLWLNKSFSIFISRKIMCKMLNDKEIKNFFDRKAINELKDMITNLKNFDVLSLVPNLTDLVPHIAVQSVPYEFGNMLLCNLEDKVGGPSVFEHFLKCYFKKFTFKSIVTKDWTEFVYFHFSDRHDILNSIPWNKYFYEKPSPPIIAETILETKCLDLAKEWITWNDDTHSIPLTFMISKRYLDIQKIMLLNCLRLSNVTMSATKLNVMSLVYDFDTPNTNCEIRFAWLRLCIKNRWKEKFKAALDFVIQCSPQYACPIFQDLNEWIEMRPIIINTFISKKQNLLYKTQAKVNSILKQNETFLDSQLNFPYVIEPITWSTTT